MSQPIAWKEQPLFMGGGPNLGFPNFLKIIDGGGGNIEITSFRFSVLFSELFSPLK